LSRETLVSLSNEEVLRIAALARLAIGESEIDDYASKLSNILDMVRQLQAADTADVEPMAHPLDMAQRLRPDAVTETVERDAYQANAPAVEDGLYLVPRVIE
jgi:aspartyl-tRNA(Asn)/glutamyl-tRNA(Gln) amidotransferase subunit C